MTDHKCRFCDKDTYLLPGCAKQRSVVCHDHVMIVCPLCGYEAFYLTEMRAVLDRYACFRVSPWCNWGSETPPASTSGGAAVAPGNSGG